MTGIETPFLEAATYGFLYLAVIFLWVPKVNRIQLWMVAFGFAVFFGLSGGTLNSVALLVMATLCVVLYCLREDYIPVFVRFLSAVALFILGAGLLGHRSMGFTNLLVLNKVLISKDGVPFTLYLNFDNTMLGILIIGLLHERILTKKDWLKMFKAMSWRALIVIVGVMLWAFYLKYVHFDPKMPRSVLLFAVSNLFFVCIAEEAFFRGFIQKYLSEVFGKIRLGNAFAIVAAAALFGLGHYGGGWNYVLLATIAGIGYGWVYFRTKRIEASILTHFILNMIHFLFFTYPALRP